MNRFYEWYKYERGGKLYRQPYFSHVAHPSAPPPPTGPPSSFTSLPPPPTAVTNLMPTFHVGDEKRNSSGGMKEESSVKREEKEEPKVKLELLKSEPTVKSEPSDSTALAVVGASVAATPAEHPPLVGDWSAGPPFLYMAGLWDSWKVPHQHQHQHSHFIVIDPFAITILRTPVLVKRFIRFAFSQQKPPRSSDGADLNLFRFVGCLIEMWCMIGFMIECQWCCRHQNVSRNGYIGRNTHSLIVFHCYHLTKYLTSARSLHRASLIVAMLEQRFELVSRQRRS